MPRSDANLRDRLAKTFDCKRVYPAELNTATRRRSLKGEFYRQVRPRNSTADKYASRKYALPLHVTKEDFK